MTWHTAVVASDLFQAMLRTIHEAGGIITGSCPCAAGYRITYVTLEH